MNTPSIAPPAVYLVALDMSDAADHVLQVACDLGAALGGAAELHLVHILPDQSADPVLLMGGGALPVDYRAGGEALIERTAARAAQHFRGKIIGHLAIGQPAHRIVEMAAGLDVDLVVVGTAGRVGVARLALGSVAEQVVRHATCPVLVVRPKAHHVEITGIAIDPPCPDCVAVRTKTARATMWCERHATHHPHGRLHYELPQSFAMGSMNFRP